MAAEFVRCDNQMSQPRRTLFVCREAAPKDASSTVLKDSSKSAARAPRSDESAIAGRTRPRPAGSRTTSVRSPSPLGSHRSSKRTSSFIWFPLSRGRHWRAAACLRCATRPNKLHHRVVAIGVPPKASAPCLERVQKHMRRAAKTEDLRLGVRLGTSTSSSGHDRTRQPEY